VGNHEVLPWAACTLDLPFGRIAITSLGHRRPGEQLKWHLMSQAGACLCDAL
jgi:hypothetical protein